MTFFTYPKYNTEKVLVQPGQPNQPWLLTKEGQQNELIVKYDVEPLYKHDTHMDLAKYLSSKHLTIDVWDADSLLHFGYVRVPLYKLMR
jgi:hypothetical protein